MYQRISLEVKATNANKDEDKEKNFVAGTVQAKN